MRNDQQCITYLSWNTSNIALEYFIVVVTFPFDFLDDYENTIWATFVCGMVVLSPFEQRTYN